MRSKAFALLISLLFVVGLSYFFHVPFVFGLLFLFLWPVVGMLITADDYMPGGWENPDGTTKTPWGRFLVFVALAGAVGAIIVLFPQLRVYGL
ncbi:hypothetical protein [Solimonas marina]|uniref:Uncharacterized protein n=1 Tax=Solimonas marina TaxID=2714601 RepID=A0A969WD70_9GAMM|nr:hypothetical protein [Solimonas marina]NKF24792.1 hypothetical protein [Solimonas marina]